MMAGQATGQSEGGSRYELGSMAQGPLYEGAPRLPSKVGVLG